MDGAFAGFPGDREREPEVLADWRTRGRPIVAAHWAEFRQLLEPIDALIASGRHARAAAAAQIAANHAVLWHPGAFASADLEAKIRALGAAALPCPSSRRRPDKGRLSVLHVASRASAIGGMTRMIWRWISHDSANQHSVALTRQCEAVPLALRDAVAGSGGQIEELNRAPGGLIAWARRLQPQLQKADIVVLHPHNYDLVPFLALAGLKDRPPVVLLNHSDHVFWLGATTADLVVSTRVSGRDLCITRRGVPPERNFLLPLCLEPVARSGSLAEARRALGIPEASVVLLTIARAVKYRPIGGQSFADALVPVLAAHPQAHLFAVGPGTTVDWSSAMAAAPGRITVLPEQPDTRQFLEAADIYIDSFPFPSNTSLFEAGLAGLPLVTRNPFGETCAVMGADSPGIDPTLIRAAGLAGFQACLGELIASPERREAIGTRTRAEIEATNMGEGWAQAVARLYERVSALPPRPTLGGGEEKPSFDDIDVFSDFVFGYPLANRDPARRLSSAIEIDLRILPLTTRLAIWGKLFRTDGFTYRTRSEAWRYLVPEWIGARARHHLATSRTLRHGRYARGA